MSGMTPKISGFTLVRNGSRFDYPYLESLRSLLPVVDELVINVGIGDDDTLARVREFAEEPASQGKIVIFESDWPLNDPEKRRGGRILSEQTNLALGRCRHDWCLYLQADEVLHEGDYSALRAAFAQAAARPDAEGLLFEYRHFYGSYDVIQQSRSAYRREVRAVKKSVGAQSVGDAQSFRKANGTKLRVIRANARIFHYGWVRTPEAMREKTQFMDSLYHGVKRGSGEAPATGDNYRYKKFWGLKQFSETHPKVMHERIQAKGWRWDLDQSPWTWGRGDLAKVPLDLFERVTGKRLFEYRSYQLIP